jgi:xanthine dehydrogenase accessory factor
MNLDVDGPGRGTDALDALRARLASEAAVLVTVVSGRGSLPREVGAWMAVFPQGLVGSIGGGHLEWQACAHARQLLGQGQVFEAERRRWALGPSLGQCCGGVAELSFSPLGTGQWPALVAAERATRSPVALFGAGHVGQALVRALRPLPFSLQWVDSRDGVIPAGLPDWVQSLPSDPMHHAVPDLVPGSQVLVMSFSHAEDLEIVAACLRRSRERSDLAGIGLIGSGTKWATFRQRLAARGHTPEELALVTCPIGLPGIEGKQPEVIAASVAAQMLLWRSGAGA